MFLQGVPKTLPYFKSTQKMNYHHFYNTIIKKYQFVQKDLKASIKQQRIIEKKETAEIGYLLMQLQIPPGDALHIALFQRSHTEKYSEKIYHKTCSISNLTLAPLKI